MSVIQAKIHFCQRGTTFILCNSRPGMTEGISAIPFTMLYTKHFLTYLADTNVYVCIKAVIR